MNNANAAGEEFRRRRGCGDLGPGAPLAAGQPSWARRWLRRGQGIRAGGAPQQDDLTVVLVKARYGRGRRFRLFFERNAERPVGRQSWRTTNVRISFDPAKGLDAACGRASTSTLEEHFTNMVKYGARRARGCVST
jgi:hypothetical protein